MKIKCAHCGKTAEKFPGAVNRARRAGAPLYCNMKCAGLARRKHKSAAERKEEKRLYDLEYRAKNLEWIKAKKHAHFKLTYDPVKAAIERKRRMPSHVEYCRRPEYKRWKKAYDQRYKAAKTYGPFAEAALLVNELNSEIKGRMTNEEISIANDTYNKSQKRRGYQAQKERSRPRFRGRRDRHSAPHG